MENQRVRLTKKLLKDSLIEILKTNTIYETTVSKLCMKAELNRSTFYKYYENIYDVLADIEYDIIKDSSKCFDSQLDLLDISSLYTSIDKLLQFMKNNKDLFYIIVNKNNDPDFYSNMFNKTIIFFKKQVELQGNPNIKNQDYIFTYIVTGTSGIIKNWIQNDCNIPSYELSKIICNNALKLLNN